MLGIITKQDHNHFTSSPVGLLQPLPHSTTGLGEGHAFQWTLTKKKKTFQWILLLIYDLPMSHCKTIIMVAVDRLNKSVNCGMYWSGSIQITTSSRGQNSPCYSYLFS